MSSTYNYGTPQPPPEQYGMPVYPSTSTPYPSEAINRMPTILTTSGAYYSVGIPAISYIDSPYGSPSSYQTPEPSAQHSYFPDHPSQHPYSRTGSEEYYPACTSTPAPSLSPQPTQYYQPQKPVYHHSPPSSSATTQMPCRHCNQMVTLSNSAIRTHIQQCCRAKNYCLAAQCSRREEFLRFDNLVHHLRNVHGWRIPKTRG